MYLNITSPGSLPVFYLSIQEIRPLVGIVCTATNDLQRFPGCTQQASCIKILKLPDVLKQALCHGTVLENQNTKLLLKTITCMQAKDW